MRRLPKRRNKMKKVLIIVLVMVMLLPAAIFAKGFSIGAGATATTGSTIASVRNGQEIKFEDFRYGAYANVKLAIVSLNATVFPEIVKDEPTTFFGDLSANLAVDVAILRIQAGLSVNFYGMTDFRENFEAKFENENILDAPLNVRAEVDVLLGDINIGIWGILPTTATLNTLDKILEVKDRWEDAAIGVCAGFCF